MTFLVLSVLQSALCQYGEGFSFALIREGHNGVLAHILSVGS